LFDQAWGSFQLSAVAHDNFASYYGPTEDTGSPGSKWGWAIQGALSVKAPMPGPGDVFNMQAVYTDGATRYNFQSLFPTTIAMFGGTGLPGAYQSWVSPLLLMPYSSAAMALRIAVLKT
jgi:hypothetical protein